MKRIPIITKDNPDNDYGEMTCQDNTNATTITTKDVPVDVADFLTGEVNGVTFDGINSALLVAKAGKYRVSLTGSAKAAVAAKDFTFGVGIGSSLNAKAQVRRHFVDNTTDRPFAWSGVLSLAAADALTVMVANNTDTENVTILDASLALNRIGD